MYRRRKPSLAYHFLTQWSKRQRRIFSLWQLSSKRENLSLKERKMSLLLLWVTRSILVVYEASSKEGWKEGFGPEWEAMYRKRDRYKAEMSNYFKEEAKREVEEVMSKILSNPPPELMQRLATAMSSQLSGQQPPQMQLVVAPTTTEQAPVVPIVLHLPEPRSAIQLMRSIVLCLAP